MDYEAEYNKIILFKRNLDALKEFASLYQDAIYRKTRPNEFKNEPSLESLEKEYNALSKSLRMLIKNGADYLV